MEANTFGYTYSRIRVNNEVTIQCEIHCLWIIPFSVCNKRPENSLYRSCSGKFGIFPAKTAVTLHGDSTAFPRRSNIFKNVVGPPGKKRKIIFGIIEIHCVLAAIKTMLQSSGDKQTSKGIVSPCTIIHTRVANMYLTFICALPCDFKFKKVCLYPRIS